MAPAPPPSSVNSGGKPQPGAPPAPETIATRIVRKTRPGAGLSNQLRLWSGLVMFGFVTLHLINHALGLVSFDAMQAMLRWQMAVTHSIPGTLVLITAALTHLILGFGKFLWLRTWRIGLRGGVQLCFGLLIPVLLLRHAIGTRGVAQAFGIETDYAYALWAMWPSELVNQAVLITLVWTHGCIGIHYWLRPRAGYRRWLALWWGLAVLIPALSYAGFVSAARLRAETASYANPLQPGQYETIIGVMQDWQQGYFVIVGGAIAVWLGLLVLERLRGRVTVTYDDGPKVLATKGMSVLDISRANRIPHASVCGGRARCSTCRIRIAAGAEHLSPPSEAEQKVLNRIGSPSNVRLACQLRPTADLSISALLPGVLEPGAGAQADKYLWGVEQEVTLLFCDLRGFTKMSEGRLSFDVVFLLNQFLGRMAQAIEDSGGFVDKFMGDGIMAIFGMETSRAEAARHAIAAARAMSGDLESLNQSLRDELPQPLAMGIGIHSGPAILGRIGAARHAGQLASLTALGETVNIASRLESKTKELGVQVAVSGTTMDLAALPPGGRVTRQEVEIRGLSQPITIYAAKRGVDLPAPAASQPA